MYALSLRECFGHELNNWSFKPDQQIVEMALIGRKSERKTKGVPPKMYGDWTTGKDSVSEISSRTSRSSAAQYERRVAEAELAAEEQIAELEKRSQEMELARQKRLIHKIMEVESAAVAEAKAMELSPSRAKIHRPSARRAAGNTSMSMRTFPASDISTRKEKVRLSVLCTERSKPRCIFPESRLANDALIKLQEALEEVDYVCGSPLPQESHPLFAKVVVHAGLTCQDDISAVYFSSQKFQNVGYACSSENPEAVPAAIKVTSQAANPVCAACAAAGKALHSR